MCLGNIDLINSFNYDLIIEIVHIVFLTWAGEQLEAGSDGKTRFTPLNNVLRSLQEIREAKVVHGDMQQPNVNWSVETERAMIIDFERFKIMGLPQSGIFNQVK